MFADIVAAFIRGGFWFPFCVCLGFFVGFTDIMIFMVTFSAKAGSDMIGKLSSHAVRQKEMLSMMRSFFLVK